MPPSNTFLCCVPLRVEQWFHALRVEAPALHHVDDSEAISHPGRHVPDPEVKPLRILFGVHVRAQGELIVVNAPERSRNKEKERNFEFTVTLKTDMYVNIG